MCHVACPVTWTTWLLLTGVPARCAALCVRGPGPFGSCSPVCSFVALCCGCGVLGHFAPVHRSARPWCFGVVLCLRCPGPLGTCLPVCSLDALCSACSVLGPLAPVHQCAHSVCCIACAVSWTTWLLLIGVPAQCAVLCVPRPGPLGSCSPVCPLGALCCVCSVLGHLAPLHRCARPVRCVACALS